MMAELGCLYSSRGVLSRLPLVYLKGDQKTERKCCVKTWTAILFEICHPALPELNLGQVELRESEGGEVEIEREIRRF